MDTTSVRLPDDLSEALARVAARRGVTRGSVIREAIEAYLGAHGSGDGPAVLGRVDDLVAYPGSGCGDLGARGEELLREAFGARRRRPR